MSAKGSPDAISIRYDGYDITDDVEFRYTRFRTGVNALAGVCQIRVRDLYREKQFISGRNLSLDVNGQRKWDGFLQQAKRGYYFAGLNKTVDKTARFFELSGVDANVLFEKRFLHNPLNPTQVELKQFAAGTMDRDILLYYMQNYLDLRDDFITSFAIQAIATPAFDCSDNQPCIGANVGFSWGDFMRLVARNIGSIFYLDPDRSVVYTDTDTPTGLVGISDDPGAGEVGCRDLEIEFGGEQLRNDAMIWGAGQGYSNMVFDRVTDATSISEHGVWQYADFRPSIFRQTTVDRIANSAVYGSPAHLRGGKDPRIAVRCTVFDHRFRAAQKVRVRAAVQDFDEVLPIRVMDISFPTHNRVEYGLQLSQEIDPIWSTFEFFFPQFDLHKPAFSLPGIPTITTSCVTTEPGGDCTPGTIVIGPSQCIQGNVEFGFEFGESGELSVGMFAVGSVNPTTLPAGYTSFSQYLIDGDPSTYTIGHFAWAAGQIEWIFVVPVPCSGATIDQCVGAPNDMVIGIYPGPFDGWRHMSNRLQLYADGVLVGDSGDQGSGPLYSISVVNDSPATLATSWVVKSVGSTAADYIGQGLEFGMRGEYGWGWWVNDAHLFAYCQTTTQSGGGGVPPPVSEGGSGSTGTDTVPGSPGARCFIVQTAYIPGSSQLFVGGVFMRPGIDYFEYPSLGKYCIADDINIDGQSIWFSAIFMPVLKVVP